jgi:hypothetical protein
MSRQDVFPAGGYTDSVATVSIAAAAAAGIINQLSNSLQTAHQQ